jgi:hypothetical protein
MNPNLLSSANSAVKASVWNCKMTYNKKVIQNCMYKEHTMQAAAHTLNRR